MRFLLMFCLFFASGFDACFAEAVIVSVADSIGLSEDLGCGDCAGDSSQSGTHEHADHDSCTQCISCHGYFGVIAPVAIVEEALQASRTLYRFSVPERFYRSLKRPPKLSA